MAATHAAQSAVTLVPSGAWWRYYDEWVAPPADWYQQDFDDRVWKTGPAPLGYGDGDEATTIASGILRPATTYFRHTLIVTQAAFFDTATLRLLRDDGAIVYVNGVEVFRSNMPDGFVDGATPASRAIDGDEENEYLQRGIWPYYLQLGSNTVAVEVHQATGGIDDCSFDLTLLANLPAVAPTVRILSPQKGVVVDPGDITISARADDSDGHIAHVEFYAGTNFIGIDFDAPYEFVWQNVLSGRYALSAWAIDNLGWRGISAPAQIQVGSGSPIHVVRGPYLQSGSTNSIVICWRTDWFVSSRVAYGSNVTNLNHLATDAEEITDHALRLTGLMPDTVYYYALLDDSDIELMRGPDIFFRTAPATNRPVRIWAIGDSGTAGTSAAAVRDAYQRYAVDRPADLWLMLGDNAYDAGTDGEYQRAVFDMYPTLLRQLVLWPTIGNHDASSPGFESEFPYLEIFTLPAKGEAGGVPSGTEKYYSFDYANIHFICLDSQSSSRMPGGSMLNWLEADLSATAKDWIIAYWHHPPYSWGTHDSDYEHELFEMRQYVLPVLERYGVDLTLCGHSHNYERSYLLNGHYGSSWQLDPASILDSGFGHETIDHPYEKPAGGLGANRGAVYVVCGCSGQGGAFQIQRHPAIRVAFTGFGSMVIDVDGDRLDGTFLRDTGDSYDKFTILKRANTGGAQPRIEISRAGEKARLKWPTSRVPFKLEQRVRLTSDWTEAPGATTVTGRWHQMELDLAPVQRVFRLRAD